LALVSFGFSFAPPRTGFTVPLEVEMRIEQNIAVVTRTLVIATVREIEAVVSFANAMCLHLWLRRMPLGMLAYSGSGSVLPLLCGDRDIDPGNPGSKRGRLQFQPMLALASCPAGTAQG
jgi:hypothetical protein